MSSVSHIQLEAARIATHAITYLRSQPPDEAFGMVPVGDNLVITAGGQTHEYAIPTGMSGSELRHCVLRELMVFWADDAPDQLLMQWEIDACNAYRKRTGRWARCKRLPTNRPLTARRRLRLSILFERIHAHKSNTSRLPPMLFTRFSNEAKKLFKQVVKVVPIAPRTA